VRAAALSAVDQLLPRPALGATVTRAALRAWRSHSLPLGLRRALSSLSLRASARDALLAVATWRERATLRRATLALCRALRLQQQLRRWSRACRRSALEEAASVRRLLRRSLHWLRHACAARARGGQRQRVACAAGRRADLARALAGWAGEVGARAGRLACVVAWRRGALGVALERWRGGLLLGAVAEAIGSCAGEAGSRYGLRLSLLTWQRRVGRSRRRADCTRQVASRWLRLGAAHALRKWRGASTAREALAAATRLLRLHPLASIFCSWVRTSPLRVNPV